MTSSVHRMRLAAVPFALAPLLHAAASFAQTPPAAAELQPVVVNATRFEEPVDSLPLGVSIVTADEIRASGATNVTEALMRILGVPGRQDFFGGGEYNLDLRGFGATSDVNQVVVLDGQRLSEADLGGTRLSGIPIDAIERIEVLRGGGSVLYGEGATGGVIVITTRAGAGFRRRTEASAYAAAGTYNLRDARASGTFARDNFAIDASAQRRASDNHRDNFRSELSTGSVAAQWWSDSVRFGASLAEEDLDARLPGALTLAEYDADPKQTTHPNDWGRVRTTRASAFARATLAGWELAADVGHRRKALRSENSGFPYDYDIGADTASLRARQDSAFGAVRNALVIGYDRTQWERDILGAFGSTAAQDTHAWYAKDDVVLPGGTRISAGVRTERLAKDNAGVSLADTMHAWELGASQALGRGITAYVRTGRSYRLASVDEFNYTSPGLAILPQTARDYELGGRWVHDSGRAELRIYRSDLRNEIGFDPAAVGPFGFAGANVNFDSTRREGVELDVTQSLAKDFALRLNATMRRATFRNGPYAGNDVPLVPQHTLALRGDWSPAAGHRVSGGVNWVSSQAVDFSNTCSVPAHTLADVRYAMQWKNAEFSLGVANLFDRKYFTQAFACAGAKPTSIYPEPGRAFTAAVRVSL